MNGLPASSRIERAAGALLAARAHARRIPALPSGTAPESVDEAYAIQDIVVAATGAVGGWKVGAKSPTAEPTCAPLCRTWLARSPARFAPGTFALNGIEGELAFALARDLPPQAAPYTTDDVVASIASVHPVIEIVESRYVDFRNVDPLSLLADFLSHGALVVGAGIALRAGFDVTTQPVELTIDGRRAFAGRDSNAGGDPFRLLAWLANHAGRRCGGLRAGDVVTTGSWTGMPIAPPGAPVGVRFDGIGEARVEDAR